jgi:hypothetical protein
MVGFTLLSRSYYYLRRRSPGPPFPPDHRQAGERGAKIKRSAARRCALALHLCVREATNIEHYKRVYTVVTTDHGDRDAAPRCRGCAPLRVLLRPWSPPPSPPISRASLVLSGLAGKLAARRQRHTRLVEVNLVHVARAEDALGQLLARAAMQRAAGGRVCGGRLGGRGGGGGGGGALAASVRGVAAPRGGITRGVGG